VLDTSLRSAVAMERMCAVVDFHRHKDDDARLLEAPDIGRNASQRLLQALTLATPLVHSMTSAAAANAAMVKCATVPQQRLASHAQHVPHSHARTWCHLYRRLHGSQLRHRSHDCD
jgi:hypothetical protein